MRETNWVRAIFSLVALAAAPAADAATALVGAAGEERLLPSFAVGDSQAGWSVDISGDTAVIGAPYDDDAGVDAGAVWVYQRVGAKWVQQQKLYASDFDPIGDLMGTSVAIDGDVIAVGAPNDNVLGSVLIFRRSGSTWIETQLIDSPGDRGYGSSVALGGGHLAIGMADDYIGRPVYVFEDVAGTFAFDRSFATSDQTFGSPIAVDGDTLVIGDEDLEPIFHVYRHGASGTWSEEAALGPPQPTYGLASAQPNSLSIDGDTLVASASLGFNSFVAVYTRSGSTWDGGTYIGDPDSPWDSGWSNAQVAVDGDVVVTGQPLESASTLRIFRRAGSTWTEDPPLTGDRSAEGLGHGLALDRGVVLAGAPFDDDLGPNVGAASLFDLVDSGWLARSFPHSSDEDGFAIAVDGATVAVGAPGASSFSGEAYIYTRGANGWVELQRITPSDHVIGDSFGSSVAVAGNVVVVGAPAKSSSSGAAYVFTRANGTFTQRAKLVESAPANGNQFGAAVAATGDWIFVGAPGEFGQQGVARVFRRSGSAWPENDELGASPPTSGDRFGASLAVDGNLLLVGVPGDDTEAANGGAVIPFGYVSQAAQWVADAKITPSLVSSGEKFGSAVAIDGTRAVIGAPFATSTGANAGRAWVYAHGTSGWTEQAQLLGSRTAAGDELGLAVAISGNVAAVGAPHGSQRAAQAGEVSVFTASGSTWSELHEIEASDGLASDFFGSAVGLVGDALLVGADGNDAAGAAAGRTYAIDVSVLPDCGDGIDNDADGKIDYPADRGCTSAADSSERGTVVCDDGIDNDGDGLVDFPNDPGCQTATSTKENPQCDDDVDNDGDGKIDWDGGSAFGVPDPQCAGKPYRDKETPGCGIGFEIAPLLAALRSLTRRRSRRSADAS